MLENIAVTVYLSWKSPLPKKQMVISHEREVARPGRLELPALC
jgi:hypothetical protein